MFPTHLCYCPTQCYLSIQNSVPGSVIVLTLDSPRERICLAGAGSAWRGGGGSRSRQQGQAAPSPRSPCSAAPAPSTASPGPGYQAPWTLRIKLTPTLWGEWWKCRAEHCRWLLSCELCGRGLVQCSVTNNHQRSLSSCHDQGRQTPSYVDMATVEQPVHLTIFCPFKLFLCCLILPIVSSELLTPMVAAIWPLLRQRVWCPWLQL